VKKILTPGTRLILVFIIIVVISGGILTYMSITSISNFKELTEKKILEEERGAAFTVRFAFQQRLDDLAAALRSGNYETIEEVTKDTFRLDGSGEFLWPWFTEKMTDHGQPVSGNNYSRNFSRAQDLEFRKRDFDAAANAYIHTLVYALNGVDSARSANAAARVYIKESKYEKVLEQYSLIMDTFPDVQDENGFLYSYYALLNILKIYESADTELAKNLEVIVYSFLKKTDMGYIPLNTSTGEIVQAIEESSIIITGQAGPILNRIQERIRFIDNYSTVIKNAITDQDRDGQGDVMMIHERLPDPSRVIFLDPALPDPAGILVSIDSLWASLDNQDHFTDAEFEYTIKLSMNGNEYDDFDELCFREYISPYYPGYTICRKSRYPKTASLQF